jgi:DNA repair protein RadC
MENKPLFKDLQTGEKPRGKIATAGASSLTNEELLAVLFGRGLRGKDVMTLAHEVTAYLTALREHPTLDGLCGIHGVGLTKGCQILAALELSTRFLTRRRRTRIRQPADALPHLASMRSRRQECFAVLTLDGSHQVIRAHEITVGLADRSQVHPRETFACALEDRAVSIMVAHNHPSGSLEASVNDLLTTRRLAEAGQLLRIPVVDHLIVAEEGFVSLREKFPEYFAPALASAPLSQR